MVSRPKVSSLQSWSRAPCKSFGDSSLNFETDTSIYVLHLWSSSCDYADVGGYDQVQFSSMTDLSFHRYGIGKTISKTNILNLGITFVGACGTRTCSAYEKCVCCKLSKGGYGKFDLAKDSCDCVYPSCEKPLKTLETCYFNKCKWEYTGMV